LVEELTLRDANEFTSGICIVAIHNARHPTRIKKAEAAHSAAAFLRLICRW
jgi:hypothetical protein